MEISNREQFAGYLHEKCKYPFESIRVNTYKYDGKEYGRVEVLSDGYIIQAFVLMSEEHCRSLDKFPFYRTYYQANDYGFITPPACNVAVYSQGADKWSFFSSSNLRHEITSSSFLNYDEALRRFRERLGYIGNKQLAKRIGWISTVFLVFVTLYFVAHIMSTNELLWGIKIPLDVNVISIFVVMIILLLLPPIIPYIRSISIKGIGVDLNQGRR